MACANEGSFSFTCRPHVNPQMEQSIPVFTPQPQSITALWLVLISRPAEGRRLSWPGWLGEIPRWFACPKTVTHPSTNRARRRVITSLMRSVMLPNRRYHMPRFDVASRDKNYRTVDCELYVFHVVRRRGSYITGERVAWRRRDLGGRGELRRHVFHASFIIAHRQSTHN